LSYILRNQFKTHQEYFWYAALIDKIGMNLWLWRQIWQVICWIVLWLGNNAWLGENLDYLFTQRELNGEQLFESWAKYVATLHEWLQWSLWCALWLNAGVVSWCSKRHVLSKWFSGTKVFYYPIKRFSKL
jgi:hypothetical protein